MKAQSLSIVVPNSKCINNCAFCVSKMSDNQYKNQMDDNLPFFDLYLKDYLKRLDFAQRNGCNTIMLTGDSEPQQNRKFLTYFGLFMQLMKNPFDWIEMQTTGVLLDNNYLRFLRNHVGVNVISLSLSSFDNMNNSNIINFPRGAIVEIEKLCEDIKRYDFTLRLSLNLSQEFSMEPYSLFKKAKELNADQVTLRVLYENNDDTKEVDWVRNNKLRQEQIDMIYFYVKNNGVPIGRLPHGATKYSLNGLSVVIDDDCMGKNNTDNSNQNQENNYKYLILRSDCKLYSSWDDPASLIF